MLLCDIGNTTYSFFDTKKDIKFKISINASKKEFPKFKGKIYFISVNNKATKLFLQLYPQAINCAKFLKFHTSYKGMGIDRQIVCNRIKNGIVVDVGSAITIDVMKHNKHKGGFILTGINKSISFYPKISSKLKFNFNKDIKLTKLPQDTNDAITYAILQSIILPIKQCHTKYKLPIYFTGEDSVILRKYFTKKSIKYKKNLIFKEMLNIISTN